MSILSVSTGPSVAAPSNCYNHLDVVTITIRDGVRTKEYRIFRGLLKWHSAYFAAALDPSSGFQESDTNTLEFIEEIEVFDAFSCWLYIGCLEDNPEPVKIGQTPQLTPLILCKIWVFSDHHIVPALGNTAIDMLHEQQALLWSTPSSAIKYVYEHTKSDSLLRRYLQDAFAKTMTIEGVLSRDREDHTVDFLHDVLLIIAKRTDERLGRMQWAKLDTCQWHDHSGAGGKLRSSLRQ